MTADRWSKIKELFSAAHALPEAERDDFLRQSCAGDKTLLDEVSRLLNADRAENSFLEHSAAADYADLFISDLDPSVSQDSPTRFQPGSVLNQRYEVVRLLGRGGMGEVYLATDVRINRKVALKVLHPDLVSSTESLRRFSLEAQAVSGLNHPHIVTIHDFATTDDGSLFIVTEFVEGKTLNRLIGEGLELDKVLDIAIQASSALSAAHEAGITHRDIKPENIMVRRDGYIKVLDFGLAKLTQETPSGSGGSEDLTQALPRTQPGMIVGTAAYMSPEQARGLHVDARTDVWSLGAVLYEMIAGRRPFTGDSQADIIVAVLLSDPPPLAELVEGVPRELESVIARALSKDVALRHQSIDALRLDLENIRRLVDLGDRLVRSSSSVGSELQEAVTMISAPDGAVRTAANEARKTAGHDEPENDFRPAPSSFASFYNQAKTHKIRSLVAAAILAAVVGAAGYFALSGSGGRSEVIDSIAVLPFQNRSGNPELSYLSDGMSEALIDRLSQLSQIKVISRSSSFKFRGDNVDPADVASQLGVRAVVSGSVEQIGDELSIRFDITDTAENVQLAGGQFRRKATELLSLRNDLSQTVYEKLRLKISDAQSQRLTREGTDNSEAYRYYLNGLVAVNSTQDVRGNALDYFERAVSLDPGFAAAYAEIGWVYWGIANQGGDPQKIMPKAAAAAERALALDPSLAKAHVIKAVIHEYEFDWAAAEEEYRRAIDLSPNLDFARNNYAFFLSVTNRSDQALAELEEQRLRDPLNRRLLLLQKGIILTQARRFDEALRAYQEAQAVEPAREIPNFSLAYAYGGKGLYADAANYYRRSADIVKGEQAQAQPLAYLASVYARMPERVSEARSLVAKIEAMGSYSSPAVLAVPYAALGENDKAMSLLEEAYLKRDVLLRYIATGYEYDGLRGDPRFVDLMKRIGMSK